MTEKEVFDKLTSNPNDWFIDSYHAVYKKSLSFWISNGWIMFTQEEGSQVFLGLINRIKLYFWLKRVSRSQAMKNL